MTVTTKEALELTNELVERLYSTAERYKVNSPGSQYARLHAAYAALAYDLEIAAAKFRKGTA